MNKKEVLQVIRNPRVITASQLKEIEKMAVDYPYFQGAHTLVAIGNQSRSATDAPKSVIKAAMYATDRKYLKTLLSEVANNEAPQPATDHVQKEEPATEATTTIEPTSPTNWTATANERPEPPAKPLKQTAAVEPSPFGPDPVQEFDKTSALTFSDHDDLLKEVFANLETLKKSKLFYLEVERQLEDAEFEVAQAQAVKKATGPENVEKVTLQKTSTVSVSKPSPDDSVAENKTKAKAPKVAKINAGEKTSGEVISVIPKAEKKDLPLRKKDQISIIDAFIKNNPSIKPATPESPKATIKDLSEPSQQLKDELVTENLALILVKQGKKEKAIEVYKKLILKVPQKKAYFATQIEELQK